MRFDELGEGALVASTGGVEELSLTTRASSVSGCHPCLLRPPAAAEVIAWRSVCPYDGVKEAMPETAPRFPRPLVHLELHTYDLPAAAAFCADLCGWQPERIVLECGSYLGLDLGCGVQGGGVECGVAFPRWVPYVAVDDIDAATRRAQELGAALLLGPREGPAGWRSVLMRPEAGELALWQSKQHERGRTRE